MGTGGGRLGGHQDACIPRPARPQLHATPPSRLRLQPPRHGPSRHRPRSPPPSLSPPPPLFSPSLLLVVLQVMRRCHILLVVPCCAHNTARPCSPPIGFSSSSLPSSAAAPTWDFVSLLTLGLLRFLRESSVPVFGFGGE